MLQQDQQDEETNWHNTHAEEDKSIDGVTMKSLSFSNVRSVIIIRLETSNRHTRCKMAYKIQAVMIIQCHSASLKFYFLTQQ